MITSCIAKAVTKSKAGIFCHPVLSDTEHVEGCKLGIYSWEDTCYAGKHEFLNNLLKVKMLQLRDSYHT